MARQPGRTSAHGGAWSPEVAATQQSEQHPPLRRYLTIDEAAEYLNVSVRFMRRVVSGRRLRHYKVGRFLRFDRSDLDEFAQVQNPAIGPDADLAGQVWRVSRGLD